MPIVFSEYTQYPAYLINGNFESIFPSMFRNIPVPFNRFELETPDGDFLEVDELIANNAKAVILSHGLEGNSRRHYITGLAKCLHASGYDVFAWNCRTCGGKMNRSLKMYHHAVVDDLDVVVGHARSKGYQSVYLAGHSMGGNISLNYVLQEHNHSEIKGVAAISAPINLFDCVNELSKWNKRFYQNRFLRKLQKKVVEKAKSFEEVKPKAKMKFANFLDFDTEITAAYHGFKDAFDYYYRASPAYKLEKLNVPVLLLNAKNDPFLGRYCYPERFAEQSDLLFLEMPERGGHSGFMIRGREESWADLRTLEFFNQLEKNMTPPINSFSETMIKDISGH
ncbi:MAG: alpha/beta fold hydrolase [Cytophagales bacterium]|nr:alpha/beta fold hydrolase [Cytophagales bacterium]